MQRRTCPTLDEKEKGFETEPLLLEVKKIYAKMNIRISYDSETKKENHDLDLNKSYIVVKKDKLKNYYGIEFPQGVDLIGELPIPQQKKPILSEAVLNEKFELEELTPQQKYSLGVKEDYRICFSTIDMPGAIYFNLSNAQYWNIKFFQIINNKISIVISIVALIISIISLLLR